jgi:hypothetical protein
VTIPLGALLSDVTVTLTVPAGTRRAIDVSVEGSEGFIFELPITVTVSYAQCPATLRTLLIPISAWHYNPDPFQLLQLMPSIDNKVLRSVTFTTGHLSGYLLAN